MSAAAVRGRRRHASGDPGMLTISNGGVVNATGPLGVGDPDGNLDA